MASPEREVRLSRQEERVLALATEGLTDKEIAQSLGIALDTVRTYWQRIREKRGGRTRAEITAGAVRDTAQAEIDERRSANAQLHAEVMRRRESETRFRAIAEALPVGVIVFADGGACVYVNPAFEAMTGCTLGTVLGMDWQNAIFLEDRELALQSWTALFAQEQPFDGVCRWVHLDGRVLPLRVRARVLADGDKRYGFLGVLDEVATATA
jgi:PAS domain S-box-containing protein